MKAISKWSMILLISLLFGLLPALAQNRDVAVVNEASSPIYHLYVSDVRSGVWGPDQLGDYEIISPGNYRTFDVDNGTGQCYFDFKIVLKDGHSSVWPAVNVCAEDDVTMTE
jgi:hypothetical protein